MAANSSGVWALLGAANRLGLTPAFSLRPASASSPAADPANPVTQALISVAISLRAVSWIADGPNTNEADAKADRAKYGSSRLYIVDPAVRVWDVTNAYVTRPASAFVAGALSAIDAEKGFWWSPSNRVLQGVAATARPIGWAIGDADTEANRLNEAEIATIIRKDGFRLWGNRSAGEASDTQWAFLSVRRTADMIYESIESALLWAMDRPFSAQLLLAIAQSYLDELTNRRAILGGKVWLDPELNTEATLKAGKLYLNFDIEPPAPLEHLTLQAHRNGDYYEELVLSVTGNSNKEAPMALPRTIKNFNASRRGQLLWPCRVGQTAGGQDPGRSPPWRRYGWPGRAGCRHGGHGRRNHLFGMVLGNFGQAWPAVALCPATGNVQCHRFQRATDYRHAVWPDHRERARRI